MLTRVNGIQHLGVAVSDHAASWKWYRTYFGMDIPFFNSVAEAPLMKHYTRDEVIEKRAAMVFNLRGGCAMEVVQPTSFDAVGPDFDPQLGDLAIFMAKFKTTSVEKSHELFVKGEETVSPIVKDPLGNPTFFVKDPNGLHFQVVKGEEWYSDQKHVSGGVSGVVIGVSDMEKALAFYQGLLGLEDTIYDKEGVFEEWASLPGGESKFRRVLIARKGKRTAGNWSNLAGNQYVELVQVLDREPRKIFKGRIWGDVGFVHLGFDVKGMNKLEEMFEKGNHPFTCDTKDILDMGNTQVRCVYVDDPDGTLIELIEVFQIPLVEKWGWFLNVQKRDPEKPLPSWMLKMMRFSRVKD